MNKSLIDICGGLGDAFISIHEYQEYSDIGTSPEGHRTEAVVNSHNPFVDEIFKWHPHASKIDVLKSKHFFHEHHEDAHRANAGLPPFEPIGRKTRARLPVRFFPSPADLETIRTKLPKRPYLAVAPSASGMEIENRNLTHEILAATNSICRERSIPFVLLGRTYQGPHAPKAAPRRDFGQIVDLTDKLSVPGTVEVVQRATAVLSAHSSLLLLSWYNRVPNFVMYPPQYKHHDFDNPSPFGFGKDYPETTRMLLSEFRPQLFWSFLERHFKRGNMP